MIAVAKRLLLFPNVLVWAVLVANCGLAQATGTLEVVITGLPQGVDARVTLSGALLNRPIALTRSGRLSQLRPGTYQLSAERVAVDGAAYTPQYLRQSVEIKANRTSRITLAYIPPAGSLLLTVKGLPAGTAARISLSGRVLDSPLNIEKSSRISDLVPGAYTLTVSTVTSGRLNYTPALARHTVVVRSREETTVTVTYKAPPGDLLLEIRGIPSGQARVTLSGPNFNQEITSSTTLEDLEAGTYTLTAQSVTQGNPGFLPEIPQQKIEVEAGRLVQAEVVYRSPPGSLKLTVEGLLGDTRARVRLAGNGVDLRLERSSTIRDLVPGEYILTAEPFELDGLVYQVEPPSQRIEIRSQVEAVATVAYNPPAGSLRLQLEGLPGGVASPLVLRGPDKYLRELNTAGNIIVSGLTPGIYSLAASDVIAEQTPYDPAPANQTLQIMPGRTLVARVTYSISPGRLVLVPQGTPAGLAAQVTVTGSPRPTALALTGEETLDLPRGNYTLTSPLLYFRGKAYGPLKPDQTVQITPRKVTRVPIAYQEIPAAKLTLEPEGLARGGSVEVVITGPNNTLIEATLSGPETLLDLLPGDYKLTAPDNPNFFPPAQEFTFRLDPGSSGRARVLLRAITGAEQSTMLQHQDTIVYSIAFSPIGNTLASGSADYLVRLWDVGLGTATASLKGHSDYVHSVALSGDGKILASGSDDRTIKLWDVSTGLMMATMQGHTGWINSVAFSPDGKMLASGSYDRTIKLWDIASRRNIATLQGHTDGIISIAFSPDGKTLASGSYDRTIKLWDILSRRNIATLQGHSDYVRATAFSPDRRILASGSDDNTIKIWDLASEQNTLTLLGHSSAVWSVAFSPDGQSLASGSRDGTLRLWSVSTGRIISILQGHSGIVRSVALSLDGKTLASAGEDGSIRLWSLKYR